MPQHKTCVRCGSLLPGSGVSVGYEPPRAGKWEKRFHVASLIWLLNRFFGRIGDLTGFMYGRFLERFRFRSADLSTGSMFWRAMIPGLAQWYIGRVRHALAFFVGWVVFLLLTFLTFGLTISAVFLGLAVSCHLSSIIDMAVVTCRERSDRIALFFVMVMGALLLFYIPTSTLCWSHLGAQGVNADAGPLRNGDTLLYTVSWRTARPRVGDVVLYYAPQVEYPSPGPGHVVNRLYGNMFDRVLAVDGQTVEWKNGQLTVDGNPSEYAPFVPFSNPPDSSIAVPEGYCYIVPGVAFHRLAMPKEERYWREVVLVPWESIYGRVWGARRSLLQFVDLNPPSIIK